MCKVLIIGWLTIQVLMVLLEGSFYLSKYLRCFENVINYNQVLNDIISLFRLKISNTSILYTNIKCLYLPFQRSGQIYANTSICGLTPK